MKIENAPTLFESLSSLFDFDGGARLVVGDLYFNYTCCTGGEGGNMAICVWDGERRHVDQMFNEAVTCLSDMLQKLYNVAEDAVTVPLDLMLNSIKDEARNGGQPARLFARKDADHWIFTAFQVFEDNVARVWVAGGAGGPTIEQIMIVVNEFAEQNSLTLTQVNAQ